MKSSDPWTPIAKLDEITKGKLLLWEEDGYSLLLTQIADQIICFENVCPHLGWPLEMSAVDEGLLICPHHGFEFDLTVRHLSTCFRAVPALLSSPFEKSACRSSTG